MLTEEERQALDRLVRPMPRARYEVTHSFHHVETMLADFTRNPGLDLAPDFQRGHVWTPAQQERWIEAVLRGAISSAGLTVQFSSPVWDPLSGVSRGARDLADTLVIVDGLQRLTAIRRFVAGEIHAFGLPVTAFDGSHYDLRRYRFNVAIHEFQTRADLLTYYLDLNAGGTPHAAEEITRIQGLLAAAQNEAPAPSIRPRPGA